jgi:DNA-binding response OmpR family regulator
MPATILIVEDEPLSRGALVRFLRAEGYRVAAAEDGTAAVKLIGNSTFDAVITDLHLGSGVDGFQVLSCFEGRFPGKGKILISGTLTDVRKRCASLGALFINKPLQLDRLLLNLEGLLARQTATVVVIDNSHEWRVNVRLRSNALIQRSENLQRRIEQHGLRYNMAEEQLRRLLNNNH